MAEEHKNRERMPLDEAAQLLGTTAVGVLMHLKHGFLSGREVDGVWQVDVESLTALRARGLPEGIALCRSHCGKPGGCSSCG